MQGTKSHLKLSIVFARDSMGKPKIQLFIALSCSKSSAFSGELTVLSAQGFLRHPVSNILQGIDTLRHILITASKK
jgi:hypothetical protein